MHTTDFRFHVGVTVLHRTGSGKFEVVGRHRTDEGKFYQVHPLKADGTRNMKIRSFRFDEENLVPAECQHKKKGFCNDLNVRLVQMKSVKGGIKKANVYKGNIIPMCAGCREVENGQFKYVQMPNTL